MVSGLDRPVTFLHQTMPFPGLQPSLFLEVISGLDRRPVISFQHSLDLEKVSGLDRRPVTLLQPTLFTVVWWADRRLFSQDTSSGIGANCVLAALQGYFPLRMEQYTVFQAQGNLQD